MERITYEQLLEAGVHFGHLTMKWNPAMAPYIFMQKNGIHIIDLMKTEKMLEEACKFVKQLAKNNKKILFVGTKKQAQEIIREAAEKTNMPYVTERWLGGMLTNFMTIRKSIRKMENLQRMETDGTFENLSKKEKLMIGREIEKLQKVLGGVAEMNHLPSALFIIDIKKEHIAVSEAQRLNIPTIGLVDTNSNPNLVNFPIPGNDDSTKSISIITQAIVQAILDGYNERKIEKETVDQENKETE
jgi:small subunit ribosomal protein S2